MTRLRRDHARDLADDKAREARRAQAPAAVKLAGLLWDLAEALPRSTPKPGEASERYANVGLIAGTVDEWASLGRELTAVEAVTVFEAALAAAGVKV